MDGTEEIVTTDTGTVDTPAVDTAAAPVTDTGAVDEFGQPAPPAEPSLDDLAREFDPPAEPNAPVEQQPEAGELPESLTAAMQGNEYFSQPEHLPTAVLAATELFDVENGKIPVWQMLEGFRARNADGFNRILSEGLIPYIEQLTGKKLGGEAASAVDPNSPEGRIERMERERAAERQATQTAEQTRVQNETMARANDLGSRQIDKLLAGTAFEGQSERFFGELGTQLKSIKLDPNKVMQETLAGNYTNFDRAIQAIQKQRVSDAMATVKALTAQYKKQKSTLPTSKQSGTNSVTSDFKLGPNATKEQLAEYLLNGSTPE